VSKLRCREAIRVIRVAAIATCLVGCTDGILLMNDSEKAFWESRTAPERAVQSDRIKFLSRDFEVCRSRNNASVLTDSALEKLSRRQYRNRELEVFASPCGNTLTALKGAISRAHRLEVSQSEINALLVAGKALGSSLRPPEKAP